MVICVEKVRKIRSTYIKGNSRKMKCLFMIFPFVHKIDKIISQNMFLSGLVLWCRRFAKLFITPGPPYTHSLNCYEQILDLSIEKYLYTR